MKRYHGICIKIAAENYFFLFFKEEQVPYHLNGFRTLRASYVLASDPPSDIQAEACLSAEEKETDSRPNISMDDLSTC